MHGVHVAHSDAYYAVYAVQHGGKRGYRYERIHIRAFQPQRLKARFIEVPAAYEYRQRQNQLGYGVGKRMIFRIHKCGHGMLKARYHGRHSYVKKGYAEYRRNYQPFFHAGPFGLLFCGHFGLCVIGKLNGRIAGFLYGAFYKPLVGYVRIEHYICPLCRKIDACAVNALYVFQRALHPCRAGRAAHASYSKLVSLHVLFLRHAVILRFYAAIITKATASFKGVRS